MYAFSFCVIFFYQVPVDATICGLPNYLVEILINNSWAGVRYEEHYENPYAEKVIVRFVFWYRLI